MTVKEQRARVAALHASRAEREMKAVERLIEEFGASIMLEQKMPFPRSPRERLSHRHEVEEQITHLYERKGGALGGGKMTPIMPRWSPYNLERTGRIAIVGEAATLDDDKRGELGHSRASKVLRHQLQHFGIHPHMTTELNTVFHFPYTDDNQHGRMSHPPSTAQTAAAYKTMINAIDAADVDYVLLLGGHAQRAWRADLTLRQTAGNLYLWRQRWFVCPMLHPNAVLRSGATYEAVEWKRQLAAFVGYVNDAAAFEAFGTTCTDDGCPEHVYGWDADAVPWCAKHLTNFRGQQATVRKFTPKHPEQGAML